MSKKIFLTITLCIGVVILFILGRWLLTDETAPSETTTTLPDTTTNPDVQVTDVNQGDSDTPLFLQEATKLGDGLFQVTPFTQDTGYPFDVLYNDNTGVFAVALTEEPVVESRKAAEEYLLGRLGVSVEELCALPILVTVPYNVNQFYAGDSLGLPSCPGNTPLE